MRKNNRIISLVFGLCLILGSFGCSKKIPTSYGHFEKTYSCIGVLPFKNETSFAPMDELLAGYLNLEMYNSGLQEVVTSKDLIKIFREEGRVYFPKGFNQPLAIEYSTLLGLDGVLYGTISTPDLMSSDVEGRKKLLNMEVYFLDVKSSEVVWSYIERKFITPGAYNDDVRGFSKDIVRSLLGSEFRYAKAKMPCWDATLAGSLRRLPDLSREMFNSLSYDLAEADELDMWMNLGNVFMSIGKRSLALIHYQKFLRQNPTSPFKNEVARQVTVIKKSGL